MGKSLALAMPFIIALILIALFLAFRAGRRRGIAASPRRANLAAITAAREADIIFGDLLFINSIETDDILTAPTRDRILKWRANYEKTKSL